MSQSDIEQILEKLNEINTRLDRLDKSVEHLDRSVALAEAYRQGTQWVVNLAFSLIVATTIGIIIKFVLGS